MPVGHAQFAVGIAGKAKEAGAGVVRCHPLAVPVIIAARLCMALPLQTHARGAVGLRLSAVADEDVGLQALMTTVGVHPLPLAYPYPQIEVWHCSSGFMVAPLRNVAQTGLGLARADAA